MQIFRHPKIMLLQGIVMGQFIIGMCRKEYSRKKLVDMKVQ